MGRVLLAVEDGLVIVRASVIGGGVPVAGREHPVVRFFPAAALPEPLASSYRRAIAQAAGSHRQEVAP